MDPRVTQFLQTINPLNQPQLNYARNVIDTTAKTIQDAGMNPGQFVSNAADNAGNMIKGIVSLPGTAYRAAMNPGEIGPMSTQFIKSFAGGINDTLGQPVNPETGQLQIGDYLPNAQGFIPAVSRAEQYAYKKPVDFAANASLVGGAIKKVAGALSGSEKAAEAGNVASTLDDGSQAPQTLTVNSPDTGLPVMNLVKKSPAEVAAGKTADVSEHAISTFMDQFKLPHKLSFRMNKDRVGQTILSDNVGAGFPKLQTAVETVTGSTGELPKMIYRALDDVKDPVDLNSIMQAGMARIEKIPELRDNPGKTVGFQEELQGLMGQQGKIADPLTGKAVNAPLTPMTPLDAWDKMQELERQGHAYLSKSTYLTDNPYYERLGQAFLDTADEIQTSLDSMLKGRDLNQYITPAMREKLGSVSPQLLQRFDALPKSIDSIRGFQKPYVDLSTLIKYTKDASTSVWSKAADAISKGITGGLGAAAGSTLGPVGAGAGALIGSSVLGPVAGPVIEAVLQRYLPDIQLSVAKKVGEFADKGLPPIGNPIKGISPALAETATNMPQAGIQPLPVEAAQGQGQMGQGQKYQLPTPQSEGMATSVQDYTDKVSKVQQIIEQEKLNNPQQAAVDQGKLDAWKTQYDAQQPLVSKYISANAVVKQANDAASIAISAPPNILQFNGSYDALKKQTDPQYVKLLGSLQYLENATGVKISQTKTKDAVLSAIDQAVNIVTNEYNAMKEMYGAPKPTPPVGQGAPPNAPQGLPAMGSTQELGVPVDYSFGFGRAGEGLPAIGQ